MGYRERGVERAQRRGRALPGPLSRLRREALVAYPLVDCLEGPPKVLVAPLAVLVRGGVVGRELERGLGAFSPLLRTRAHLVSSLGSAVYRDTSLIRNTPSPGPYRSSCPGPYGGPEGGGGVLMNEVPL